MIIHTADPLRLYAESALARLRYLYPALTFSVAPEGIEVKGEMDTAPEELQRAIHHALYREKIYAETLPMRRALMEAVTRR
jgi:hypothetical protein